MQVCDVTQSSKSGMMFFGIRQHLWKKVCTVRGIANGGSRGAGFGVGWVDPLRGSTLLQTVICMDTVEAPPVLCPMFYTLYLIINTLKLLWEGHNRGANIRKHCTGARGVFHCYMSFKSDITGLSFDFGPIIASTVLDPAGTCVLPAS